MDDFIGEVGILGSGTWATALAKIVLQKKTHINWFIRRQEQIDRFRQLGHNPSYLSDVRFDLNIIDFYNDINAFVNQCDTLIIAVPSPYLKSVLSSLHVGLDNKFIISAIKGIVPPENLLVTDYLAACFHVAESNIAIIGGPCHAEEIALERSTFPTIACVDEKKATSIAALFTNHFVKASVSIDVVGIELAAVLKNIYAIASGICRGLNYGDNFQAVLVSNAMREVETFIDSVCGGTRNICDSAYMGDLLVTAYSTFSRNRTFGTMVGKGYSVQSAQIEMQMVAEGYYGTKCIYDMNKDKSVDIPIADAVYRILYEHVPAYVEMKKLKENILN